MKPLAPFKPYALCSLLGLALPVTVAAQDNDSNLAEFASGLPTEIQREIARDPDRLLKSIASFLFSISPDGIVAQSDIDLRKDSKIAAERAQMIAEYLKYDLGGDGTISAQEIEQLLRTLSADERGNLSVFVLQNDEDKDGSLSFVEILNAINEKQKKSTDQDRSSRYIPVLAFDFDKDGKVSVQEVALVIAAYKPPSLEKEELRSTPQPTPSGERCKVPAPAENAEVVMISMHQTYAFSNLTIAGQDEMTSVAVVNVEEGTTPLHIFANSHEPVIWKFEGATNRIQNLIVQPGNGKVSFGAAVSGLEKDKITFVPQKACVRRALRSRQENNRIDILKLQKLLGARIDHFALGYANTYTTVPFAPSGDPHDQDRKGAYDTPVVFSIGEQEFELSSAGMTLHEAEPAATEDKQDELEDPGEYIAIRHLMRYRQHGLIPLDPNEIHASAELEPYSVLPAYAGLLQLMAEGSIEFDEGYYVIKEPIERFPGGLSGAHSVKFILATGVPMPEGTPGHSFVLSEETGECLTPSAPCRK